MIYKLNNIYKKLGLKKNNLVILASSVLNLSVLHRNIKKKFNPEKILDELIKFLGHNGTLLLNTFNWDFCKNIDFDYNKTKAITGRLSNIALFRKEFERTYNPIYSFAVTGKNKKKICNIKHTNCFGMSSPFGYMIKNNGKALFIDIDYKNSGFTFVHVAEQIAKVRHRYIKEFNGNVIKNKNKKKLKIKMYARKLNLGINTHINPKLDLILKKNNALKKTTFKGINFSLVDLKKTHEIMLDDLINKKELITTRKINNK